MITEELKQLVIAEATALRQHATKEELQRLDFTWLDPQSIAYCIYGQMTGNCDSERAIELQNKSTRPYSSLSVELFYTDAPNFNKRNTECIYSPIEVYINQPEANSYALIAFLKGKTDTLTL